MKFLERFMKFYCEKENLLKALIIAQRANGAGGTLPVLENILLSAEGQSVEVSATNLELSITTSFESKVQNEGRITVPAKTIISWMSLSEGGEVSLEKTEGESIFVQTKGSKTKIKGLSADDFPPLPLVEKHNFLRVSQKEFKIALSKVSFAAANGGTRPVLSGLFLWSQGEDLYLVGTDSYRLSEKKIPLITKPKEKISLIIPVKTLIELERILGDEGDLEIIFSQNQVLFLFNRIRLVSRLIDGQFPNYQQILPKDYKNEISLNRRDFIQTIKRVGIFARENNNNIKLIFSKESVIVTTDATEIGSEEAILPIKNNNGENTISLNSQFLLDVLLVFSGEEVLLHLGENLSPLSVISPETHGFLHIIMPLKN